MSVVPFVNRYGPGVIGRIGDWAMRNPRTARYIGRGIQSGGRIGLNYASSRISNFIRSRNIASRPSGQSGRNVRRRLNPVANSASHGGTRSFVGRRKRMRKGFGTRRYGRKKGRRSGKRKRPNIMTYLRKVIMTPQVTKVTRADNYTGVGPGCRSWYTWLVNSRDNLVDMWQRRPQPFFTANVANPIAAGSQSGLSSTHKCIMTSFMNKFTLQNRSNWDMELKVYECVVRRDHSFTLTNVGDTMTDWVIAAFQRSDSNVENKGILQPSYAGAGDALGQVERNPMYTPYMSNHFTNKFRIVKTTAFKIAMNDYVHYYCKVNKKSFAGPDLGITTQSGYQENIGGWTKILLFSWVGGPMDDNITGAGAHQTKAQADLFVQCDVSYKFYFEPRAELLYNIASSNATVSQLGHESVNRYSTLDAPNYVAPATQIDQSSGNDDVPATHP